MQNFMYQFYISQKTNQVIFQRHLNFNYAYSMYYRVYAFRKISKKQEMKSKEIEARILAEKKSTNNQQNI